MPTAISFAPYGDITPDQREVMIHSLSLKGEVTKVKINNTDWLVVVDTSTKGGTRFNNLVRALGEKPETFLAKVPGFSVWLQAREGYEAGGTLYIRSTKEVTESRSAGPKDDKFVLAIRDDDAEEVWTAESGAQVDYATLVDPHRSQSILVQTEEQQRLTDAGLSYTKRLEASMVSREQALSSSQPSESHDEERKKREEEWLQRNALPKSRLAEEYAKEQEKKAELEEQAMQAGQSHIDADADPDGPSEWTQVGARSYFNIPRLFQKYLRPEKSLPSLVGSHIRRFQRANALRIVSGHGRLLENVSVKV